MLYSNYSKWKKLAHIRESIQRMYSFPFMLYWRQQQAALACILYRKVLNGTAML